VRRQRFFWTILVPIVFAACARSTAAPPPPKSRTLASVHLKEFEANDNPVDDPGSPGELRAIDYAKKYFESLGLQTHVQTVPLVQMIQTSASVDVHGPNGEGLVDSGANGTNFLIWAGQQKEHISLDASVVFAGYGIVAPEYHWDDYKNVNVAGKIVIVLEGSPHTGDRDDLGVLGETHYGTRFYKFAEAARHGAAAILIIHSDPETPWEVIRAEASGAVINIDENAPGVIHRASAEIEGWLSLPAAARLVGLSGLDLRDLVAEAHELAFTPVTLPGFRVRLDMQSTALRYQSHDVIAILPGRTNEYLMMAGRWNRIDPDAWTHTFTRPSSPDPAAAIAAAKAQRLADLADDDGTGAAFTMETAERLVQAHVRPLRGIAFMVTTAMKSGTVGLEYYLANPLPMYPVNKLTALLFLDRGDVTGNSQTIGKVGTDSDGALAQMTREAAIEQGRLVVIDQDVETRFYYTLGQEALTNKGVRVIYLTTRPTAGANGELPHVVTDGTDTPGERPRPADPSRDSELLAAIMLRAANATNWPARTVPPSEPTPAPQPSSPATPLPTPPTAAPTTPPVTPAPTPPESSRSTS
jgi:Zn-dependent M28 family amino/carboxypeptidase